MTDAAATSGTVASWLLRRCSDGAPLTQTGALSRAMVREAVEAFPWTYDVRLTGPPHQEADVRVLVEVHQGLRRSRLLLKRGKQVRTSKRGRVLLDDPAALRAALLEELAGGDPFSAELWGAVHERLQATGRTSSDDLERDARRRLSQRGWSLGGNSTADRMAFSWELMMVLARAEGYGVTEGHHPEVALAGGVEDAERLVFHAKLCSHLGAPVIGVGATLAVPTTARMTALHDALQEAFGWQDDHLYSFWLDGSFWGAPESEVTSPVEHDSDARSAVLPLRELDLRVGQRLAYVFDFGDEWRVMLTLREVVDDRLPPVIERTGQAPPKYGDRASDGLWS